MDNYSQTEIEGLLWNASFRKWVINPTPELDAFWYQYLQQNPDKGAVMLHAREAVLSLQVKSQPISEIEIQQTVQKTLRSIIAKTEDSYIKPVKQLSWHQSIWIRVAASILLFIALGWGLYNRFIPDTNQVTYQDLISVAEEGLVEKVNTSDQPLTYQLADGSRVTLQKDSRISFNPAFKGSRREVYLSGEAFFEVTKDPSRPFYVYANELVTKVLGTSFKVRSYEADIQASVEVRTGKVSVYAEAAPKVKEKSASPESEGMVLTPNQRVIFSRKEIRMAKLLVEQPVITAAATEPIHLEFEDTPVTEVFAALEKAFSVEIVYDEELLRNCPLTASLINESLFEKLNIICKAIEAKYEVIDGQIVIYSEGC